MLYAYRLGLASGMLTPGTCLQGMLQHQQVSLCDRQPIAGPRIIHAVVLNPDLPQLKCLFGSCRTCFRTSYVQVGSDGVPWLPSLCALMPSIALQIDLTKQCC